ncbi:hypothetical protein PILCRDRAFT_85521 [Piloderma croceum F 1598]|uniref:Uncharacterized protein n=1 Tax=Piloderma croceum (strain F 1598) TaxID=765440 RepID=A0A0C3GCE0_PILCF|nr:hypothetical protein PILCRDRAFT_85521 [Piloderma croceum F 1598]
MPATTFDSYELLERMKLKDNTFICLHKFQHEVVILRLVCSSGSVVDPTQAKYTLWNCTWNRSVSPIRQGGEIYFIMTITESYSLLWQNEEVGKYGNRPEPPHTATPAEIDERRRINNAAGVFVEKYNWRAIQQARSQGVEVPSPMIGTLENIIGMDVDPTEWDPELFIPCQGLFLPRDCTTVSAIRGKLAACLYIRYQSLVYRARSTTISLTPDPKGEKRAVTGCQRRGIMICKQPQTLSLKLDSSSFIDIMGADIRAGDVVFGGAHHDSAGGQEEEESCGAGQGISWTSLAWHAHHSSLLRPQPPPQQQQQRRKPTNEAKPIPTSTYPQPPSSACGSESPNTSSTPQRAWTWPLRRFLRDPVLRLLILDLIQWSHPKYRHQLIFLEQVSIEVVVWAAIWGWGTTLTEVSALVGGYWVMTVYCADGI